MLFRGCVVAALMLLAGPAMAGTDSWTLAGRVLDAEGRPAAGVDLSVFWNANGVTVDAVDARGIAKGAQIADFKGKWVLVYFWGPNCRPCLGRHLPALMEFHETHKKDRDRFEIVAVCLTEPDIKTMADLDRELLPVLKAVWHEPLSFPVVLDNTPKTVENFGVATDKLRLLFDPAGRLVPGDEKTLAEKLKSTELDTSQRGAGQP